MQNKICSTEHSELSRVSTSNRGEQVVTRAAIIEEALTWEGIKFKHQGRSKKFGCDCIGMQIAIGRKFGLDKVVNFDDERGYGRTPDGDRMTFLLNKYMIKINIKEAQPGDLLHMKFNNNPQHIAMLMPDNNIIHSDNNFGKVVRHRLDSEWSYYIYGAYSFKGVI